MILESASRIAATARSAQNNLSGGTPLSASTTCACVSRTQSLTDWPIANSVKTEQAAIKTPQPNTSNDAASITPFCNRRYTVVRGARPSMSDVPIASGESSLPPFLGDLACSNKTSEYLAIAANPKSRSLHTNESFTFRVETIVPSACWHDNIFDDGMVAWAAFQRSSIRNPQAISFISKALHN